MIAYLTKTLQRTIVVIALLAILPTLAVLFMTTLEGHDASRRKLLAQGDNFVASIAERQRLVMENIATLFALLSRDPAILRSDYQRIQERFRNIIQDSPALAELFLVAPDGTVLALGLSKDATGAFTDNPTLIAARTADRPRVSDVTLSPFTGQPVIQLMQPVRNDKRELICFLGAEVRLATHGRISDKQSFLPSLALYVLDRGGAPASIAMPDGAPLSFIDTALWPAVAAAAEPSGVLSYTSSDKRSMLAIYRKLRLPGTQEPFLHVALTMPEQEINSLSSAHLRRDMLILLLAFLGTLGICLSLGFLQIVKPVRRLLNAMLRLGSGALSTRVSDIPPLYGEFAALAKQFNKLAAAQEEYTRQLEEARTVLVEKSKAKSEFLVNMSHEIRTPMNAILGMTRLARKTPLPPGPTEYSGKILDAARLLLRIINDVLDCFKIETGHLAVERVVFRLSRVLALVRGASASKAEERGIYFAHTLDETCPAYLRGDPLRLARGLTILVDTAMSHCRNSPMELSCKVVQRSDAAVTVRFTAQAPERSLLKSELDQIREGLKAVSLSRPLMSDDMGVNLHLYRNIFQLLGGATTVENLPDNGFRMFVTAPFETAEMPAKEKNFLFDGERVLVADPNRAAREALVDMLNGKNLRARGCAGVGEAVRLLRRADQDAEPFDLVILDMHPSASETAGDIERIKYRLALSHPPLVALAVSRNVGEAPAALYRAGLDAFWNRSFSESTLVELLDDVFKNRALPLNVPPATKEPAISPSPRVLLVCPAGAFRDDCVRRLREAGLRLRFIDSGAEALALCAEDPLPVDIMLINADPGGTSAANLAASIRRTGKTGYWKLPLLLLGGKSPEVRRNALAAGMNAAPAGPFALSELLTLIRDWQPLTSVGARAAEGLLRQLDEYARSGKRGGPLQSKLIQDLTPFLFAGRQQALRDFLLYKSPEESGKAIKALLALVRETS